MFFLFWGSRIENCFEDSILCEVDQMVAEPEEKKGPNLMGINIVGTKVPKSHSIL